MRIAIVCQSYPPMVSGAALVIQRLAEGLADRGHSVLVLSSSDQGHRYTEDYGELEIERFESLRNPLRVDQYFILWSYDHIYDALNRFHHSMLRAAPFLCQYVTVYTVYVTQSMSHYVISVPLLPSV